MGGGHPAMVFGLAFLCNLFSAFILDHTFGTYGDPDMALSIADRAAASRSASSIPAYGVNYLFAGRKLALFLIDAGYWLVTYLVMGVITRAARLVVRFALGPRSADLDHDVAGLRARLASASQKPRALAVAIDAQAPPAAGQLVERLADLLGQHRPLDQLDLAARPRRGRRGSRRCARPARCRRAAGR